MNNATKSSEFDVHDMFVKFNSKVSWSQKWFQKMIGISSLLMLIALVYLMPFFEKISEDHQIFNQILNYDLGFIFMFIYMVIAIFFLNDGDKYLTKIDEKSV